ncbi:MAG: hypothetical protein KME60_32435 [Cyanomargarita calcarea GSE-NOS-MK-12-04C]|jgi:hypothetical protein|uniref:Late competence development ComFB family protein n=1 Tax=Cyanomargarita calcarea GSE-NOS-MK-12-04C TaxID=2839659 RepID=A0A951QX72_9CYAN|nr:hypothetical protein [Cyanomargarita calcarea GSE-NOS-MK-12-04C]
MSHELINLTLPTVIREIENALNEYPEHPYQSAFSIHELRQQLIAHILSQIPNRYAVEGLQESTQKPKALDSSPIKERLYMETVVHGSILHILRQNADSLSDRFSLNSKSPTL